MTMLDDMTATLATFKPYEREMMRRLVNGDADDDLILRADIHVALREQKLASLARHHNAHDRAVAQAAITECLRAIARLPFRQSA